MLELLSTSAAFRVVAIVKYNASGVRNARGLVVTIDNSVPPSIELFHDFCVPTERARRLHLLQHRRHIHIEDTEQPNEAPEPIYCLTARIVL